MKRILSLMVLPALIMILAGCGQSAKPDKELTELNSYKFTYTPYDNINVKDKDLYNTVFNIIRNKLVFHVTNTFPSVKTGQPVGLVIELSETGMTTDFETVMKGGYVRGWSVMSSDLLPIAKEDIDSANSGKPAESIKTLPKALYFVQVLDNNSATVYVRYWMLQYKNYDSTYSLIKDSRWRITNSVSH